jgi:DNA-binding GntR family transcriptional regulator
MVVGGTLSEQWADSHRRFHATLVAGCGSPTLLEIRQRLYERSELYRWWSACPGEHQGRDVADEHAGLVAAVLARDADLAVDRMTAHIETTTTLLLTSRQPTGPAAPVSS